MRAIILYGCVSIAMLYTPLILLPILASNPTSVVVSVSSMVLSESAAQAWASEAALLNS